MTYQDGELIELYDEDGSVYYDEVYVRGHVTEDEAIAAYREWWLECCEWEEGEEAPALGPWRFGYARWSTEHWGGNGLVLRRYSQPGRGRFKVTWAEEQRRIDQREQTAQRAKDAIDACLARFPGAQIHSANGWKSDVKVWFDVPGTKDGAITWYPEKPDAVWVNQLNLPHWERFRGQG